MGKKVEEESEKSFKMVLYRVHRTLAGVFNLGLDMGKYIGEKPIKEKISWLKNNFPDSSDYLVEYLKLVEKSKKSCDKCDKNNDLDSKYCSQCGTSLDK